MRAGLDRADHAAGRPGEDRVLALEQRPPPVSPPEDCMNISLAAGALGAQFLGHLVDIAPRIGER